MAGLAAPALAEKGENCLTGFLAPQAGQAGAGSSSRRCKCSNAFPQARQAYS
jgi:hypothetical protein